ncbi:MULTISPECIES: CheR family methyltransferase [unclassified Duganella]|uniref:CheR family methyltransferase n=1 Tax=unclassified Duganella TaxID=2636909 RepID=UPI001E285541|nr:MULTISPECIES: CheR family methyltransferase [unclassified Duganella]
MNSLLASLRAALRPADPGGTSSTASTIGTKTPPEPVAAPVAGHADGPRRHSPSTVEELELELLLEAAFQVYGYDYRGYQRDVVTRRVQAAMKQLSLATISELQARVLHDPHAWNALLRELSVEPALMFDDASEVSLLRMSLGVCLHGAALPRVWLADCAGAQQAWTLAILLEQEQLGARTEIYATVSSDALLAEAQAASLPMARLGELQANYVRSGGTGKLLDYFEVSGDGLHAALLPQLRSRITWAQYNLVTDASFNEFQMIFGRRALPDFGPALRQRVLRLFDDSLAQSGLLVLDRPLELDDPLAVHYKPVFPQQPWYKRVA